MAVDRQRQELLRRVWLFADLDDRELGQIAAICRERTCAAGEVLIAQGDGTSELYAVIQGRLKVVSLASQGEEVLLTLLGPGDVFGELSLLDEEPRSATVVAAELGRLLVVPATAFRPVLLSTPALGLRLLQVMARHVRRLSSRTEDAATLDVRARLAKTLLGLGNRFGVPGRGAKIRINIGLSQQELGRLVGATREMVNKCLREWETLRVIEANRSSLVIARAPFLEAIAKGRRPGRSGRPPSRGT